MYYNKMALVLMMWIYFITVSHYIHCRVITINSSGKNRDSCCTTGNCLCNSLHRALQSIKSDTILNITDNVLLDDIVEVENLNNITVTGNNVVVMCNNTGGVSWRSGDNIHIEGITWNQCGNPEGPITSAMEFNNVFRLSIVKCTFQYSKACRTISLSAQKGDVSVYIANSNFLFNGNSSQSKLDCSVFYCLLESPLNLSVIVEHSVISSNEILGALLYNNANSSHIIFSNLTVSNNSQGGVRVVSTMSYMIFDILLSTFIQNNNGALALNMSRNDLMNLSQVTFTSNTGAYNSRGAALYVIAHGDNLIYMSHCNLEYNNANYGDSIVYIASQDQTCTLSSSSSSSSSNITVLVNASRFVNNQLGSVLHLSHVMLRFHDFTLFQNNSAEAGAAIYVEQNSLITVDDESLVKFVDNVASLRGGAIYSDLSNCINNGILFSYLSNFSSIEFINNAARISGNSIYFNIPKSCKVQRDYTKNDSVAYIPYKLKYTQSHNVNGPPIASSPYSISLCSSKCNPTGENCFIAEKKMLGQVISFVATVCDYFNAVAETVQFRMECSNCDTKYRLLNNELLFNSKLPNKISVFTAGAHKDVVNDTNVTLEVTSVLSDNYKEFSARLSFILSTCYNGFSFRSASQRCDCYYNSSDKNIVQCQRNYAEIKLGYWFGIIFNKQTTSLCPISYCNFNHRTKTKGDYYVLPGTVDGQCSLYRTGLLCSDCKPGYTLSYNSFKCIKTDFCSSGMTALVIALTFIYWTVIVAVLFGLTFYFNPQVSSGYFNGVIYFYSIVDILLIRNLYVEDGVFYAVAVLSSFTKLTPKVLGRLCLLKGLDAIDQQFIQYSHVLCVSFILIGIVIAAKCFTKLALYVNRCISCVTYLFLLLSYTTITSTSLQLLRGVQYDDNDGVFVYLSPHIKYFTHRHAVYGTVALLCGFTVVIGLPLLLVIEPFLRKKIIFKRFIQIIKFKPILEQFQGSYNDNYQSFAANYLLCRLVIMLIVYFGNSNYSSMVYYMQTACAIMVINQLCFRPYKKHVLNVLDTAILLTVLLVVNLNNFDFSEAITVGLVCTLLFIPFLLLLGVGFAKPIEALRMKWKIFNVTPMIRRYVICVDN